MSDHVRDVLATCADALHAEDVLTQQQVREDREREEAEVGNLAAGWGPVDLASWIDDTYCYDPEGAT